MICPHCHSNNREGAKFCDNCGFPLSNLSPQNASDGDDDAKKSVVTDPAASSENPDGRDSSTSSDKTALIDLSATVPSIDGKGGEEKASASSLASEIPEIEEPAADAPETSEVAEAPETPEADKTMDLSKAAEASAIAASDLDKTVDLSGLDTSLTDVLEERLVDKDYTPPTPNFRDGATMKMAPIEGAKPEANRDFRASATKEKNTKKRTVVGVILAILVVCAAIAAGVTYHYELWGGKTVPDVTGMTQADATNVLESAGFTVRTTQVKSDDTEGLVLIEDPEGSTRQPEGSEVVIHISVARTMPSIVGATKEDAEAALNDEGFENVTYEEVRSDEAEGTVLSVTPEVGKKVLRTDPIVVQVAIPYTVPDVSGMTVAQAEEAISDAGLKYQIYYTYSEQYADGTILGTDPAAGEKVQGGSFVNVNVSKTRSAALIAATQSYLASGATVTIGGVNYTVNSLDSVQYLGSNQTSYTITATPYVSLLGETLSGSARSISGTITWNDDNTLKSIS